MNRVRALAGSLLLVAVTARGAEPDVVAPSGASTFGAFTQFAQVLKTLDEHYIDPGKISSAPQVTTALREFVRALDPDAEVYAAGERGSAPAGTVDLGLWLAMRHGVPTVVSPRDGTAAQRAGLLSGEQIVAINDQATTNLRLIEIERQLRGRPGDKVLLRLLDPGAGVQELVITRATPAPAPPVGLAFLKGGVGYARLGAFTPETADQLGTILRAPPRQQPAGLILDLRHNPGGPLPAVQALAELFLADKKPIVTLQFPRPQRVVTFTSDNPAPVATRLVVLVNAGTADTAEILAAALRDHGRARLVGVPTFGLGRQFRLFALAGGGHLSLPVAYYLPPAGQPFHGTGLQPDVIVPLDRDAERRLAAAGFGQFPTPRAQAEALALDRQLAKALDLLTP